MHHFVNQFASAMLFCNIFFKYSQCIFFLAEDQKENVIRKAMRGIEAVSCIQFREYSSPPTSLPYLNILSSDGCWSYIGKNSGPGVGQELSLTIFSCTLPSIATHEFLHALGMFHEQSRIDRDQYVNIHTENIIKGKEQQFSSHNTNSLNSPYDPDSIMHYPRCDLFFLLTLFFLFLLFVPLFHRIPTVPKSSSFVFRNAFSKNEKPTITWKIDPSRKLGGNVLTASDIYQLNAFYECPSMPKTTPSTTTIATTPSTTTTTTTTTTKKPTTTAKKTMTTTRRPTTTKSRKATTTASSSTTIATNPKTQVPPGRVECSFRNQKKISSIC
ncbi:zinc metalloproteinase nas-14-like isoform X1 [Hydractinia symbiolongicarpus]|uniref:zinc metalloproteinase nas-14-like isoform X1 n=1 Tax=Hydractinia symbiolongicarpus TaxID=13093 RepID=UPI002550F408|nr:zinc metalloproteinase nas-14-like isoform X1 [Hydractinia symbiolongicarpus]